MTGPARSRWLWYLLGMGMIGWGAKGLVDHSTTGQLLHTGRLFVLALGGHDAVFAPVAFVVGYLTQRVLPPLIRTPVRVGFAVGGVLVLLAVPLIRSDHRLRNPSILPLPYERNLLLLLGGVAVGILVSIAVQLIRARAQSQTLVRQQQG